jgi:hypothetical protein
LTLKYKPSCLKDKKRFILTFKGMNLCSLRRKLLNIIQYYKNIDGKNLFGQSNSLINIDSYFMIEHTNIVEKGNNYSVKPFEIL